MFCRSSLCFLSFPLCLCASVFQFLSLPAIIQGNHSQWAYDQARKESDQKLFWDWSI